MQTAACAHTHPTPESNALGRAPGLTLPTPLSWLHDGPSLGVDHRERPGGRQEGLLEGRENTGVSEWGSQPRA